MAQELKWDHQYQNCGDPRRNDGSKRRRPSHPGFFMRSNVIVGYTKQDPKWFSTKLSQRSNRVGKAREHAFRNQLTSNVSQSSVPISNQSNYHGEANDNYQIDNHDENQDSMTATAFDICHTNFSNTNKHFAFDISNLDGHIKSVVLETNSTVTSSIPSFDLRAPILVDLSMDVSLRNHHLEAPQAIPHSELRAPFLGSFAADIPSRCSYFEISWIALDSDPQASFVRDVGTDRSSS